MSKNMKAFFTRRSSEGDEIMMSEPEWSFVSNPVDEALTVVADTLSDS